MLGLTGDIAIDKSVAGLTVSIEEPETDPIDAVIVVLPAARENAFPHSASALLTVATDDVDVLQVARWLIFCVVSSVKVPIAVNCCVFPRGISGFVGVTARDLSVAVVTVSMVEPDTSPDDAVITGWPGETPYTLPLLTVASEVNDDVHVAKVVKSCLVLLEKVPIAVSWISVPLAILGSGGVIDIVTSIAGVTVTVAEPEMPPDEAVIVAWPCAIPTALPFAIVATAVVDEFQLTNFVMSRVVLFE
jgi:hypothetical protein